MYAATPAEIAAIRWRHLSYIMQGSMSVLNPVRRVRHAFVDFAYRHIARPMPEFLDIVRAHLQRLHLAPDVLEAYPHELSGGMRQRVTIALATVCRPDFIIADEPTTALDVVVQKDVLAMIREIQREIGSSLLFVTHDLAVHANLCDRLGVMYAGRLVEEGPHRRAAARAAPSLHGASGRQPAAHRRHRRRRQACRAHRPTSPIRRAAAASIRAVRWRWTSAAGKCRRCRRSPPRIASPALRVQ